MVLCDRRCRMYGWSEPLLCIQIHLIQHLEVYLTLLPPLLWCCVMFCYLSQLFLYYSTHSLRGMQRQVRRWKDLLCCYCENITGTLQVFHHAYLGRYFPPLSSGRVGPGLWSTIFLFFLSLVYWPNLRGNRCHKQKNYRPLLHGSSQCREMLRSLAWVVVRWLVNPSVFRC